MPDPSFVAPPEVVVCESSPTPKGSGVSVATVRVFHFRCLRQVEVPLGPTTVLIGENNVGKTSFLDALHSAIGSGLRHFSEEDIWLNTGEKYAPRTALDHRRCSRSSG